MPKYSICDSESTPAEKSKEMHSRSENHARDTCRKHISKSKLYRVSVFRTYPNCLDVLMMNFMDSLVKERVMEDPMTKGKTNIFDINAEEKLGSKCK